MSAARSDPDRDRANLGRNLAFTLLDTVGRAIVTGEYDGKRFPTEGELSQQYGVSRSVTREAMKMLAAKGLVSARPKKGTALQPTRNWNLFDPDVLRWLLERKFSLSLLRHFTELRLAMEPFAAGYAATRGDAAAKARIAEAYEQMALAADTGEDTLEPDIAFHRAILHAGRNPFFVQFDDVVATALRTSIRFTNTIQGHSASIPQHHAVLRAIQHADAQAAQDAMMRIVRDVLTLIDERDPDAAEGPRSANGTVTATAQSAT